MRYVSVYVKILRDDSLLRLTEQQTDMSFWTILGHCTDVFTEGMLIMESSSKQIIQLEHFSGTTQEYTHSSKFFSKKFILRYLNMLFKWAKHGVVAVIFYHFLLYKNILS